MSGLERRPRLAAQVRLQSDKVTDDPVLLFPEGVLVLNETADAVLRLCDGRNTIGAIMEMLANEYEVERAEIERDVCACLHDLARRKLVMFES
jgi:pyrroloquinoline quinone biosynthesis protein D